MRDVAHRGTIAGLSSSSSLSILTQSIGNSVRPCSLARERVSIWSGGAGEKIEVGAVEADSVVEGCDETADSIDRRRRLRGGALGSKLAVGALAGLSCMAMGALTL